MAQFDPEQFEDKYANYFTELQQAYKQAFETMNDRFDSELIHAIDQFVLNESEPFYEGATEQGSADGSSARSPQEHGGQFRIELPENPYERLEGVLVDEAKFEQVLERYVDEIEAELRDVFDLEEN